MELVDEWRCRERKSPRVSLPTANCQQHPLQSLVSLRISPAQCDDFPVDILVTKQFKINKILQLTGS